MNQERPLCVLILTKQRGYLHFHFIGLNQFLYDDKSKFDDFQAKKAVDKLDKGQRLSLSGNFFDGEVVDFIPK